MRTLVGFLVYLLVILMFVSDSHAIWKRILKRRQSKKDEISPQQETIPKPTVPSFLKPRCKPTSGYDPSSNWCYGTYCDRSGNVIHWDDFNCKPTTTAPTTFKRPGCVIDGKYYAPGAEISRGYDKSTNWCYGTICDKSGQLIAWDNFNCKPTTKPTTSPPPPPPRKTGQ